MRKNHWRLGAKWRRVKKVIHRRDKCCQLCSSEEDLEVHHIEDASYHPKKRYRYYNLIVLCRACHQVMFHNLFKGGTRMKTSKEDFFRFMSIARHYIKTGKEIQ